MKKSLLAVSVAAALGLVAGAAGAATTVSANGVGHTNIIPYFSVQNGNATLISITNTDTVNGKAVKVRFRGAEWSDDIFDFQVFLSPGDVFTGAVTAKDGLAKFATADKSCTLPASVNKDFVPVRLQNQATGTLEGYVEIITMADIPPTYSDATSTPVIPVGTVNPLYTAIKHVNGVAPCTSTVTSAKLENLIQDNFAAALTAPNHGAPAASDNVQFYYMNAPVLGTAGSLTSYATIINVAGSKAFSNVATAIANNAAKKAYFRQSDELIVPGATLSADRIFDALAVAPAAGGAAVPMYQFDLPDLSTALDAATSALLQRDALTTALAKASVVAEFSTLDTLNAATDVVISQPTRRYFYNYTDLTTTPTTTAHATIEGKKFTIAGDDTSVYSNLNGATNRVALADVAGGGAAAVFYDREENKAGTNIVISPTPPGGKLSLKGEVSVVGINNGTGATGALGALLTINDITAAGKVNGADVVFEEGWARLSTSSSAPAAPRTGAGPLPVIGFSASNVFNGGAGASGTNYGTTLPLRYLP